MGNPRTESPIEDAFLDAIKAIDDERVVITRHRRFDTFVEYLKTDWQSLCIFIAPQVWVGKMRVDFLLGKFRGVSPLLLAVECDGQQFHRANYDQIERDADRDRELLSYGVKTMRFTGKQIHADQWRCARRALRMIAPPVHEGGFEHLSAQLPAVFATKDERWIGWKPRSAGHDQ